MTQGKRQGVSLEMSRRLEAMKVCYTTWTSEVWFNSVREEGTRSTTQRTRVQAKRPWRVAYRQQPSGRAQHFGRLVLPKTRPFNSRRAEVDDASTRCQSAPAGTERRDGQLSSQQRAKHDVDLISNDWMILYLQSKFTLLVRENNGSSPIPHGKSHRTAAQLHTHHFPP